MDISLLRSLWVKESYVERVLVDYGIKKWLSDEKFYMNSYIDPCKFTIFCRDSTSLKQTFSFEAFRFMLNSMQTFADIQNKPSQNKISAWVVIQSYYAAFFSAHALLRVFGKPFVNIEAGHANILRERLKNDLCIEKSCKSGNFYLCFDNSNGNIDFSFQDNSHFSLWSRFYDLCIWIRDQSLTLPVPKLEQSELQNHFDDLSTLLTKKGLYRSGTWLSQFRNTVNYKSYAGAWYPFPKNRKKFDNIARATKTWRRQYLNPRDIINLDDELEYSLKTSCVIVQTAYGVINDYINILENRSGIPNQFLRYVLQTEDESVI